jgi:alpha-L-rhamnosidase
MTEQMRFMEKYITDEGIMDCKNEIVNGDHRFDRWLRLGEWVAPYGLPANHLVHTYFLWRCADVTSKAAGVLGRRDDEKRYRRLAEDVKAAFHKKYYNPETKSYGDYGANVFALHMGVPQECLADVVESFRTELSDKYNKHLNTGIFGTRRLFEMLAQNGLNDLAYEIINQKDYPSFGWWIEQGATTTWERWDGKDSRNHPMFGGGLTWFYNTLAGVNIDEAKPGYKHIVIRPLLLKDLEQVTYSKMTPYGQLKVEIEHKGFSGMMTVTVPVGATATVWVPGSESSSTVGQGIYNFKF